MEMDRASRTAQWVAWSRTLGRKLPPDAQLADDPYGAVFAGTAASLVARHAPGLFILPLRPAVLYMQVRTRAIDDVLRGFVAGGGRQVVLLGAGYDARAARFAGELEDAVIYEVDHPATQVAKRSLIEHHGIQTAARYLPFDFERRPVTELPKALAQAGLDRRKATLTIWEGVTMYLSETAIDASVRAVHEYSAAGSPFVVNYVSRDEIDSPSLLRRVVRGVVARAGEPFLFGWPAGELDGWLAARGFGVEWDKDMVELARGLLPERHVRLLNGWSRSQRIALVRRSV